MIKKLQLLSIVFFISFFSNAKAQLWNRIKDAAQSTIENKSANKTKEETGKAFDKAFDKKTYKKKKDKANTNNPQTYDEGKVNETKPTSNSTTNTNKKGNATSKNVNNEFKVYQKFDFISGEKILIEDDFSKDEIGDLPAGWNSSGNSEIVKINNTKTHWLKIGKNNNSSFVPEMIKSFPDNFTLEFDLVTDFNDKAYAYQRNLNVVFTDIKNNAYRLDSYKPGKNNFLFSFDGGIGYGGVIGYSKITPDDNLYLHSSKDTKLMSKEMHGKIIHVSIWRQKTRMKLYLNETKIYDIPRAFEKNVKLNGIRFFANISTDDNFYISNLRYAIGKPDTRNKLLTEGKFVTHSITFKTNSANLKPSSFGVIKKIAEVLKDNPKVNIKIIGYTDADGDEKYNQELSEKRAIAVKEKLINQFEIDTSRIKAEGKGEKNPIDNNKTAKGKANNRRVEFIKI